MKKNKLFLILSVAAAALVVFSCAQKEAPYESGEVENDNPYNIFFDTLKESAFQLDPADPTQLTFKVFRDSGSVAEKLTVPVVLTPAAGSEDIFTLSEVVFPKDSVWTEFTASFPNAEVGKLYSATVAVTDPKFIHIYSDVPKSISFSVQRVKWNSLGKGTYYDDLLSYWSKKAYDPVEVEFLQCDTDHSLFRIMDPYTQILSLIGATSAGGDDDPEAYIQIKVLKKGDKVGDITCTLNDVIDFGQVPTGYVHPSYAEPIYLLHPKYFAAGADPAYWSHSQVVSYQENGLPGEIHLAPYYYMFALGGFNYSQYDDDIDIIFPGFVPTDYTMLLEADYPSGGSTPIYMEVGSDIKSVKYAVYEGTIGEKGAEKKIETITSGEDASTTISEFEYYEDEDIYYVNFDVTPAATGLYTVVAIGYDAAGDPQGVGFVNFQFIAEEDEDDYAVNASVGAEATSSRYEAAGHTTINSFSYWIAGKDLTEVHVAILPSSSVNENSALELKYDSSAAVDEDVLEEINSDGGYATLATGLNALTEYTVLVWATNGNLEDVFSATYTTDGLPLEPFAIGDYEYVQFFSGTDSGLTMFRDPNVEGLYVIPNWGYGVDFKFYWDGAEEVLVEDQWVGYNHSSYGPVWVDEFADYAEEGDLSTFADDVFSFNVVYYVSAGYFGYGLETFTITEYLDGSDGAPKAFAPKSIRSKNLVSSSYTHQIPFRESIAVERTYVPVNAIVTINTERGAKKHFDKFSATIEKF